MADDDIEFVIANLAAALDKFGFGWVAEQAQNGLPPDATRAQIAVALINAAEAVTIDLAEAEVAIGETLGATELDFTPPPDDHVDDDTSRRVSETRFEQGRPGSVSSERMFTIRSLTAGRSMYKELKNRIDANNS